MRNKYKLKAIMGEHNVKVEDIAKILGVTIYTVYNKLNKSNFTLEEAEKISDLLGIKNTMEMFFPEYVEKVKTEMADGEIAENG